MLTTAQKLRNTFGYYALFVCLGLGLSILGPTLTLLACQTGSTTEAMGSIFLTGSGGAIAGTLLGGRLYDRVRRGNALLGGSLLLWAGLIALMPLTRGLWPLLAINFVRGALEGMINTGGNTLLLWTHREKASPYINGLHFSFGVGTVVAPLLVAAFVGPDRGLAPAQLCAAALASGYPWAYWIVAAFGLAVSLWVLTMADSPDPAVQVAEAGARTARPWLLIAVAALYLFAYVSGEISFGSWIATYARELGIADTRSAAVLTSVFWLAFTLGRLVSIPVAIWFRPGQVIPVAIGSCLLVTGLLVVLPLSGTLLWVAAAGVGFFMAPLWPSGYTLAGQVISLTGFTSSLVLLGDSFGGMVLPSLTGKLMDLSRAGGHRALAASLPLLVFVSLLACLAMYLPLAALARRRAAAGGGGAGEG